MADVTYGAAQWVFSALGARPSCLYSASVPKPCNANVHCPAVTAAAVTDAKFERARKRRAERPPCTAPRCIWSARHAAGTVATPSGRRSRCSSDARAPFVINGRRNWAYTEQASQVRFGRQKPGTQSRRRTVLQAEEEQKVQDEPCAPYYEPHGRTGQSE